MLKVRASILSYSELLFLSRFTFGHVDTYYKQIYTSKYNSMNLNTLMLIASDAVSTSKYLALDLTFLKTKIDVYDSNEMH